MSDELKLFDAEYRFALIVWENEPIHSRKLTELCTDALGWKRTTTYTVLRKLCERGIYGGLIMDKVFLSILNMSLTASFVIVVVCLCST